MTPNPPSTTILFVNQFCGFLCRDLANGFANAFSKVDLFTGNPEGYKFEEGVWVQKKIAYNRKNLITRFFSWVLFTFQVLFSLKKRKYKAWVLVTNPPFIPLLLGWFANKKNIPYFIIVYDLYPNALSQVKLIRKGTWIFTLWAKINKSIFSKASGIITLSLSMENAMMEYLPDVKKPDVIVIPNWFESLPLESETDLRPPILENLIKSSTLNSKIKVIYAGNFGLTHDLESILEAAHILKHEPSIQFVFLGDGAKKKKLLDLVSILSLNNVEFLPYQRIQDFQKILKQSDIAIVSLGEGAESISIPSKTYTAMAAGLCILGISNPVSELNSLMEEYKIGMNIPPNQPEKISDFLLGFIHNPDKLSHLKNNSKQASRLFTNKNVDIYINFIQKNIP